MIAAIHHCAGETEAPWSILECTQALEVSRSGYYGHLAKAERPRNRQDQALGAEIEAEFEASRQTYGSRRIVHKLRQKGARHSRRRVARLMRQRRLNARRKGRFRPRTTNSRHGGHIAPNLLLDTPNPLTPNKTWVTDITYIQTTAGWRYLSATLDLCTRKILAWKLLDTLDTTLCTATLQLALERERPDTHTLIHHSDRGVQYASFEFRSLLALSRIAQSMSRRANCYDNAFMESFWATFKSDCLQDRPDPAPEQLEILAFDYIETFYNASRLHSSLNYQSPLDFERTLLHTPLNTN